MSAPREPSGSGSGGAGDTAPLRILLFLRHLATGGAERQFAQLAGGLCQAGHEVCLATLYPGGPLRERLSEHVSTPVLYPARRRWGSPAQALGAARRLRELVRSYAPDVVYSALYMGNAIAHRALRSGGPPLVWGLRCEVRPLNWKMHLPFAYCRRHAREPALVISNSRAGLVSHREHGFCFRRELVIPNGIDTGVFRRDPEARAALRSEWGVPETAFLIGLVGRLTPTKDHSTFLAAAARFRREHGDDARFVCVGEGSPQYTAQLRRRADALGLDGALRWAGRRGDMPAVYSALDLSVSTSVAEGFANVLGEAMACEAPCVATPAGDAEEVLGEAGEVVPPGDVDAHVSAWERVHAATAGERATRGRAGRQRIVTHFGVERCVERVARALASVVETGAGDPR